jgi:hypothetical protein
LLELIRIKIRDEQQNTKIHESISQAEIKKKPNPNLNDILRRAKCKTVEEFWIKNLRRSRCSVFVKPIKNENNRN